MYYSYAVGIDNSILTLCEHNFTIESDSDNYQISFPIEEAKTWETFIMQHLKVGHWNEYLSDSKIIFIFHLDNGFKRYEIENFSNDEVLNLCEKTM